MTARVPLSRVRRIGYGIGDIGFNLYFTTAALYLLYYYTDVLGLAPATAGWIFAAAMIWDAVADPVMGYLASRTRSRWGRYRPYLLFGAVPLAASWVLIFWPTGLTGGALVIFTLAAHMLFRTVYTIVSMPYLSLSAAMTSDSTERGILASIRMLSATAAGLCIAFFTLKLAAVLGGDDALRGFYYTAILYGCLAAALHFGVFAATAEDPAASEAPLPDAAGLWRMIRGNRPFWIVAGWLMVGSTASTLFGKTLPYLFKYGLHRADLIGPALAAITATAMLSIPFWTVVMRRTSKRTVCLAGSIIGVIGYAGFAAAGDALPMLFAALAVLGFGGGAGFLTFWAMVPDTVEYGEWQSGVRAEGIVFGLISFIQKAALGVAVGVLGELLGLVGYVANQPQTADTLAAMRWLMTTGPAALGIIGALIIARYPLDRRRHADLVDAIATRRAAASVPR
jgi:glycoside/pentoside/hexuronide:cation symporter, GPH family